MNMKSDTRLQCCRDVMLHDGGEWHHTNKWQSADGTQPRSKLLFAFQALLCHLIPPSIPLTIKLSALCDVTSARDGYCCFRTFWKGKRDVRSFGLYSLSMTSSSELPVSVSTLSDAPPSDCHSFHVLGCLSPSVYFRTRSLAIS